MRFPPVSTHLNHGISRFLPLFVTELHQDQLKAYSFLLQASLRTKNFKDCTKGFFNEEFV